MIVDLSKHHDPITNLFPAPGSVEEWEQYRLTKDQIEFFHTNGYLTGIHLLNDDQIEALRVESTELMDPIHPANDLLHLGRSLPGDLGGDPPFITDVQ